MSYNMVRRFNAPRKQSRTLMMINTLARFSSTLRLEMLSASVATPRWGAEARLTVQASHKQSINCVQPTQQAISLLTDLYPICHVDPAKQTISVTWLQMFLSHRPIANNLQFGFIPDRQGSAPEAYEDSSYCLHLRGFLSYQKTKKQKTDFCHSKAAAWDSENQHPT